MSIEVRVLCDGCEAYYCYRGPALTMAEVRRRALELGYVHSDKGNDYCPECAIPPALATRWVPPLP